MTISFPILRPSHLGSAIRALFVIAGLSTVVPDAMAAVRADTFAARSATLAAIPARSTALRSLSVASRHIDLLSAKETIRSITNYSLFAVFADVHRTPAS